MADLFFSLNLSLKIKMHSVSHIAHLSTVYVICTIKCKINVRICASETECILILRLRLRSKHKPAIK